jgi:hypothetical protein
MSCLIDGPIGPISNSNEFSLIGATSFDNISDMTKVNGSSGNGCVSANVSIGPSIGPSGLINIGFGLDGVIGATTFSNISAEKTCGHTSSLFLSS